MERVETKLVPGMVVVANDDVYGRYVGELLDAGGAGQVRVKVKIRSCLVYPSQTAIILKSQICERHPFPEGYIKQFDVDDVASWEGDVPEYGQSVKTALEDSIRQLRARGELDALVKLLSRRSDVA